MPPCSAQENRPPTPKSRYSRYWWVVLVLIVLLSGVLRLGNLGQSPPGLNQDEAVIAWNAYCLLETGKDQAGVPFPIFHCRALAVAHDMLSIYAVIPFQALGGLNVVTTRLPAAVGGIITVLLTYLIGARLFDRRVGLVAAALLAVNPWHLQQSRWGHEAPLSPLVVMLSVAMLLWANLPFLDNQKRRPRIVLSALAGIMVGVSCYGYAAIKLFLPIFLLAAAAVTFKNWWKAVKTPRGAAAIGAMFLGVVMTFGPLVYKHLTDPKMMMRGDTTFIWKHAESRIDAIGTVAKRYAQHFLPEFLFAKGDGSLIQSPPGIGQFHWYILPLMILGLIVVLWRFRSSNAARILLVWVILYPVPDILSWWPTAHALRSLPGICGLVLLGALGTVATVEWLWKRRRSVAYGAIVVLSLAAITLNALYLPVFFGKFNRDLQMYHSYQVDLLEACKWLKPRMKTTDAVFVTTQAMNQPYILTLVALEHDPERWFDEPREYTTPGEWDHYTRYGKMRFMYGASWVDDFNELANNGKVDRVFFVLRPWGEFQELRSALRLGRPVHVIRRPDGQEVLYIVQRKI